MATTGLPAVDYFVTDHFCDPEDSGSERVYVEKITAPDESILL